MTEPMAGVGGLEQRKRVELERKLGSLGAEFKRWRDESAAGKPFEKHYSQIRRVTIQLESLHSVILEQMGPGVLLGRASRIERDILELYRIWEYFRAKLALREAPWVKEFLVAADQLVWACYEPVRNAALAAEHVKLSRVREPPLVFLNGGSSPFAASRRASFEAEAVGGERLSTPDFLAVLRALPIPVIGIPWFQLGHLPDAVAVAHETGHVVHEDLSLDDAAKAVLTPAAAECQAAFTAWRPELFADGFGAVALGPAYLSGLISFLAGDPTRTWDGGDYPPPALRVIFTSAVLDALGLAEAAKEARDRWAGACAEHDMGEPFSRACVTAGRAFAEAQWPPLGGKRLAELLPVAEMHYAADQAAGSVGKYQLETNDPRALFAAARLAFDRKPAEYGSKADAAVVAAVQVKAGTRAGKDDPVTAVDEVEKHDQGAGRQLLALLHKGAAA